MNRRQKLTTIVCYSDGCPEHEPPEDDCIECAKVFWQPRLKSLAPPEPDLLRGDQP